MAKASKVDVDPVANDFVDFLNASPTAFHAVDEAKRRLKEAGYEQVYEKEEWELKPGGKYFFTRNYSTVVAFAIGHKYTSGNGFHIVGAHTDSPCLKLKPCSKVAKGGFLEVAIQTYGGGLWHTWFDRDLTVAGRVIVKRIINGELSYSHELVRVQEPILRIPTLAIHLDKSVNDGFKVNTQSHLVPVLATAIKAELHKLGVPNANCTLNSDGDVHANADHHLLLLELLASEIGCRPEEICDFELQLCDTQPSVIAGIAKEFVFSGRLDNLCMSFCSLKALLDATSEELLKDETGVRMVALFDHEEVGSNSAQGAGSPVMLDALSRVTFSTNADSKGYKQPAMASKFMHITTRIVEILASFSTAFLRMVRFVELLCPQTWSSIGVFTENRFSRSVGEHAQVSLEKVIQRSFLVSADMAHCLHPNYMDKHEDNHQPKMHKGLVIKHNANQRYATNAVTSFIFREIAKKHNLPIQDFVVRNDMPCGSTIGPILASGVGIRTVDIGAPQLSMHSIREMCGVDDVVYSYRHMKAFFEEFTELDSRIKVDC